MEWLQAIDEQLFILINGKLHHPILDFIMPIVRDKEVWIPLYLILVGYAIYKFKVGAWKVVVLIILTITATDQISSNVVKPYFERERPCNALAETNPELRTLISCRNSWSFTSSHATSHGAAAVVISGILFGFRRKWVMIFSVWALWVCWAQIYVGVHYPFDMLGGLVLGCSIGFLAVFIFRKLKVKEYR